MRAVPRATEGLSDKIVVEIRILRLFIHQPSVLRVLPLLPDIVLGAENAIVSKKDHVPLHMHLAASS